MNFISIIFNCFIVMQLLITASCYPALENTPNSSPESLENIGNFTNLKVHKKYNHDGLNFFWIDFYKDGQQLSHDAFLDAMADSKSPWALTTMREFAKVIREQHLDTCGFSFHSHPVNKPYSWLISGVPGKACQPGIRLDQAYNPNNAYKDILSGNEHKDNRKDSSHSIAFNSTSMKGDEIKRLIIPKGQYVTLYNFADKASLEEITDFFGLLQSEVKRLFKDTNKLYSYEVHTGSKYYQAVPHFHWRAYEYKDNS